MDSQKGEDRFDLNRFVSAQDGVYARALAEVRDGQKETHWMWFIFPQIDGLGRSSTAIRYAIKSLEEARAYLQHPVLGKRLKECSEAALAVQGRSATAVFGHPDDMKLKSSMTLFEQVDDDAESVFGKVLAKYFNGERDQATLNIIERMNGSR